MFRNILMLLLVLHQFFVFGQETDDPVHAVKVIAKAYPDSILVRWAPTTAISWDFTNEYGYSVTRSTILKGGKLIDYEETKLLTESPLLPASQDVWERLMDTNDYASIAAQAIFGETFDITEDMSTDILQVVNKVRETEMRHSFALFAADQSRAVADAAGLFIVDRDIKKDEKYLYRVYSNVPKEIMQIDTGFVYIGPSDYAPLPSIVDFSARATDRLVELSWNRENYERIFNSFIIERAKEGEGFKSITDQPIVNTHDGSRPKPRKMFKLDSLPEYNQTYLYRVRGINAFGELGPPNDSTVSVIALRANEHNPMIIKGTNINNNSINVEWDFPEMHQDKIKHFILQRTVHPKGKYDTVALAKTTDRQYLDLKPSHTNYYRVTAVDMANQLRFSHPYLVQLVDSIPPLAPTGLTGSIDTTGQVTLRWQENKEDDIYGYRVYRANYPEEEFSQITYREHKDTTYYDQIPLNNLNAEIYYKVMAIDLRSNHSGLSDYVELIKPDKIPPVDPVIRQATSTSEGAALTIVPSSSSDVIDHLLYRKNEKQSNWTLITKLGTYDSTFIHVDATMSDYRNYQYRCAALDKSGLESSGAQMVTAKKIDKGIRDMIEKIYAEVNRESKQISIEWTYEKKGVDKYMIYRNVGEQYNLHKTIPAEYKIFIDKSLKINTVYKYKIMAVYQSGARSSFSQEVIVNY